MVVHVAFRPEWVDLNSLSSSAKPAFVQIELLEGACIEYLAGEAEHMDSNGLLCLAQLADHLGLTSLLDTAAEHLILLPWHSNMSLLTTLLKLSVYTTNTDKRKMLLHHPRRGACTELQVLAVLENMGIPRADCASALELQRLQPAELQGLIAALVDSEEDPGPLLRAAAKQQLVPEALRAAPDWTKNVRFVHNIMMPDSALGCKNCFELPQCKLKLRVYHKREKGKAVSAPAAYAQFIPCCLG